MHGRVIGCPLHSLGAEVSALEPELCAKIHEIMAHFTEYLETAIRDAHADGSIHAPDAVGKARMLFAYFEGCLTQARIKNDVDVLREMEEGSMCLLGHVERAAVG
jgi:TetR/AcrR family transcriptional repressor of nem operon